jgi:hypothetical protein
MSPIPASSKTERSKWAVLDIKPFFQIAKRTLVNFTAVVLLYVIIMIVFFCSLKSIISDFIKKTKFLKKKNKKGKFHEIKNKNVHIKVSNHEGQRHQNKDDLFLQDRWQPY